MDGEIMNKVLIERYNFSELKILKTYLCICNSKNNPKLLKIREYLKRYTSHKLYYWKDE